MDGLDSWEEGVLHSAFNPVCHGCDSVLLATAAIQFATAAMAVVDKEGVEW